MKRNKATKLLLLLTVAATATVSAGALLAGAETMSVSDAVKSFSINDGASVRIVDSNKANNGLKYIVSMPKTAYETVKNAYADVTFGVLIAPEEWLIDGYELTEANVFGANAVYGFAEYVNGQWVYEGDKPQIVNLSTNVLTANVENSSVMEFGGAMVNIRDGVNDTTTNNLAYEFRGVGYMSYTESGATKYVFVGDDDNVRSMTHVAQMAIESGVLEDAADEEWLQEYYIDPVTNVATSYTVEHYLQGADGEYTLKETQKVSDNVTIDDTVSLTANSYAGYTYNEANSKTTGKAYANGKLTLSAYYDRNTASVSADLGLQDLSQGTSLDLSAYADYIGENELYLTATGEIATAIVSGTALDMTGLSGAYTLRLASENGVAELTFDAYDGTKAAEWNTVSAKAGVATARTSAQSFENTTVSVVDSASVPTGLTANGDAFKVSGKDEAFAFNFLSRHSKAYYEAYAEKYSGWGMQISFDYYVTATQNDGASAQIVTTMVGFANTDTWTEVAVNEWYSITVPLSYILEGKALFESDGTFYQSYGGALRGDDAANSAEWYFANFAITYETLKDSDKLADLNGATYLEEALLDENQQAAFAIFKQEGEVTWSVDGVTSFELADLEGVYTVKAVLNKEGRNIVLYEDKVDLYNSADGLVWAPTSGLKKSDVYLKKTNAQVSIATENLPSGLTADEYYYIASESIGDSKNFLFSITGHSLAYYQMWQEEAVKSGSSYTIAFDIYYTTTAELPYSSGWGKYYTTFVYGGTTRTDENVLGGTAQQVALETVTTIKATLASLLNNYANFENDSVTNCGTHGNNFFGWFDAHKTSSITADADMQMYIGNFRTTFKNGVTVRDYSSDVKLETTDGVTGKYDLTSLLSADDKAAIGEENLSRLTWKLNGEAVSSQVDVETLDGLYEVTLSESIFGAYDIVYFKAAIDFYKEADGLVWAPTSGLKTSDVLIKDTKATVSIVKDNLPSSLSAGEYYRVSSTDCKGNFKLSVLRHSKKYYQMWQDKATALGASFTISYDVYYSTNVEISFSAGFGNTGYWSMFDCGELKPEQVREDTQWTYTCSLGKLITYYDNFVDASKTSIAAWSYTNMVTWTDGSNYTGENVTMDFYFGNVKTVFNSNSDVYIDKSSTTTLVDLNGVEDYDFTELYTAVALTEDETTALSSLALTWKVNGEVVTDWDKIEGVCTVTASTGFDCYDIVHFQTKVDFYNSADGMVWLLNSGLSTDNMLCKGSAMSKSIVTDNLPTGAAANEYFYVTAPYKGSDQWYTFSVKGLHTKAYYEMWQTKTAETNQTYYVQFDFWHNSDSRTSNKSTFFVGNGEVSCQEQQWYTLEVSLDWIITNWSNFTASNNGNPNQNFVYCYTSRNYGDDYQAYVGNFQCELRNSAS